MTCANLADRTFRPSLLWSATRLAFSAASRRDTTATHSPICVSWHDVLLLGLDDCVLRDSLCICSPSGHDTLVHNPVKPASFFIISFCFLYYFIITFIRQRWDAARQGGGMMGSSICGMGFVFRGTQRSLGTYQNDVMSN